MHGCLVTTALGDAGDEVLAMYRAFGRAGWRVSQLALFPEPNVANIQEHLLAQDVVWVAGGRAATSHDPPAEIPLSTRLLTS